MEVNLAVILAFLQWPPTTTCSCLEKTYLDIRRHNESYDDKSKCKSREAVLEGLMRACHTSERSQYQSGLELAPSSRLQLEKYTAPETIHG